MEENVVPWKTEEYTKSSTGINICIQKYIKGPYTLTKWDLSLDARMVQQKKNQLIDTTLTPGRMKKLMII